MNEEFSWWERGVVYFLAVLIVVGMLWIFRLGMIGIMLFLGFVALGRLLWWLFKR